MVIVALHPSDFKWYLFHSWQCIFSHLLFGLGFIACLFSAITITPKVNAVEKKWKRYKSDLHWGKNKAVSENLFFSILKVKSDTVRFVLLNTSKICEGHGFCGSLTAGEETLPCHFFVFANSAACLFFFPSYSLFFQVVPTSGGKQRQACIYKVISSGIYVWALIPASLVFWSTRTAPAHHARRYPE